MAYVEYTENGKPRQIECREAMTIGRDETCDVVLPDPRVSRRHAMLYRTQDGSHYLVDEGSSNGSYVNAARITLPTRLSDGDKISIGATNLEFRQPGAAPRHSVPRNDERRTTLVVMPEFGRDPDGSSSNGFFNHRTNTEENRLAWMMVLGQAVRKPGRMEREVRQIDLAPTLGTILGVECRQAEGRVLPEFAV